ncbi:DUF4290 domain-containing protein [Pedobacter sp. HMF7647]|uniref:DUF4290 domain-containing protein n=1 Tax=Hufsiella arboris TaxID=2695275 RepID=A0A7K1YGV6_9SPHI|nr:DUF4290 domain-containing protein [Hufsiella arboris]MXV53289.1 DUF4290 domain-containing protein [Hufsiella arboris]
MNFDYNSTRKKLILAEYGRNVQNMVAYICDLPTKDERNAYAQVVIDLMGFLNPHLRDVADFKHKLWDHLHIISDFKIDVDAPYPKPELEAIHLKPQVLSYPQKRIKFKHYGKTVELMIDRARQMEEGERKQLMIQAIANFMKIAYVTWNKDTVADETIISDLKEMSRGELVWRDNMNLNKVEFRTPPPGSRQKNNNQNNNQNKNRQNNNNNRNQNNRPRNNGGGKRY